MLSRSRVVSAIGACTLGLVFHSVHANVVTNPSFETFTGAFGSDGGAQLTTSSTTLAGWTVTSGEVGLLTTPNSYQLTASEGANFIDLSGYFNSGFPKGIFQSVSGLSVGGQYVLSLDIGILNGTCGIVGPVCHGPVQVSANIGSTSQTFTHNSGDPGNIWGSYGFGFAATDSTMLLEITGISLPAGNIYIGLDNVSIEVVPLPAAAWLLASALSLAGLGYSRRRHS